MRLMPSAYEMNTRNRGSPFTVRRSPRTASDGASAAKTGRNARSSAVASSAAVTAYFSLGGIPGGHAHGSSDCNTKRGYAAPRDLADFERHRGAGRDRASVAADGGARAARRDSHSGRSLTSIMAGAAYRGRFNRIDVPSGVANCTPVTSHPSPARSITPTASSPRATETVLYSHDCRTRCACSMFDALKVNGGSVLTSTGSGAF